jgi:hypothetical protein
VGAYCPVQARLATPLRCPRAAKRSMRRPRSRAPARGRSCRAVNAFGAAPRPAVAVIRVRPRETVEQHEALAVDGSSVEDVEAQRVTFEVRDPASPGSDYARSDVGRQRVRSASATHGSPLRPVGAASCGHPEVPAIQASAHQRASPSSTPVSRSGESPQPRRAIPILRRMLASADRSWRCPAHLPGPAGAPGER